MTSLIGAAHILAHQACKSRVFQGLLDHVNGGPKSVDGWLPIETGWAYITMMISTRADTCHFEGFLRM